MLSSAPVPKAYNGPRRHFTNLKAGRIFAALLILSGMICLLFTEQVYFALPYILGVSMAAIGINHMIRGICTEEFRNIETKLTANGIVYLILGGVILYHHGNADDVIGSIWGILGLIKGSEVLNKAIYHCAAKEPFIAKGIEAVIELWLGILLLLDPSSAVQHHVFILGLELAIVGWQLLREVR